MVAFCAGMLEAMGVLEFFLMDVTCPGFAPCMLVVMGMTNQTAAIREAIQASTAQDDQATAREPVNLTGAGNSEFFRSL